MGWAAAAGGNFLLFLDRANPGKPVHGKTKRVVLAGWDMVKNSVAIGY
jgi:hypothetical protein